MRLLSFILFFMLSFSVYAEKAEEKENEGFDVAAEMEKLPEFSPDLPVDVRAKLVWLETYEIYEIGLTMPEMGTTDKVKTMHQYQLAADILRERSDALPLKFISLSAAVNSLRMCVSMSPTVLEQCEMVLLGLNESRLVVFPEEEVQQQN